MTGPRIFLAALALVAACGPTGVTVTSGPDADLDEFAVTLLDGLQPRSFAEAREFCGYIERGPDGSFATTPVQGGNEVSCDPGPVTPGTIASFHTHGAYTPDYNNELPSSEDLYTDFANRIDGYISTPGGRIWRVDYDRRRAFLMCGAGCVRTDPDDIPADAGPIRRSYSIDALQRIEG